MRNSFSKRRSGVSLAEAARIWLALAATFAVAGLVIALLSAGR
jgi:hypothetical protein